MLIKRYISRDLPANTRPQSYYRCVWTGIDIFWI